MEKYLKPERFEIDPSSKTSGAEWLHWIQTFENFIEAHKEDCPDSVKLKLLTNYVSPQVFSVISEINDYRTAIRVLENTYVKRKNILFARHCLATRQQETSENVDMYLQSLHQLAKDCDFKAVTAEQNKNEYIRDALVSGLLQPLFINAF